MKEKLYYDQVASDLIKTVKWRRNIELSWRLELIIPFALLAYGLWLLYEVLLVSLVILIVPAFNAARLAVSLFRYKRLINMLSGEGLREKITLSREVFSHATKEQIFVPRIYGRLSHINIYRTAPVFSFRSGAEWQIPIIKEHYSWSGIYNMPERGLYDTTLVGDEVYLFTLNADRTVRYAYNTKLFELQ